MNFIGLLYRASTICLMLACASSLDGCMVERPRTPATRDSLGEFPGAVRLTLPKVIYAAPGIEANIYFDNIVLVINPANYVFDVTCDKGFQYDERWTFTPAAGDAGDYPIMIEVRDQTNAVIARARSTIHVAAADAGGKNDVTFLAIGDSHLQKDVYLQHVLQLSNSAPKFQLTLVGCRGKGNQPPTDDLRHEGYNGWTAEAFATRNLPKPRTGHYAPGETGSPFIYVDEKGVAKLDFRRYCQEFNHGRPVDFVIIQLGGNDIWNTNDDNVDQTIDKVFGFYDQLIQMIHAYSHQTRIGIVMLDPLTRSQHGYRNYRGPRKQTRWQYRRDQHCMVEREIERFGGRENENIFLVPVHLNLDCVHGFGTVNLPINSRSTTKEARVNDGAHMAPDGYRQYGDSIYSWLRACMAGGG